MSQQSVKDMVGYTLVMACRAHSTRVRTLLNALGLHPGQEMFLLSVWEEEGLTQTELADRLQIQRATVTNSVNRLEKGGLLERRPDPDDGRIYRIYLTDKGRQIHNATRPVWDEMETAITTGLTPAEAATLHQLLAQVAHNLSHES
ncbi:MAG TPA: MarR family transcriptional regulator [Anaerolineae bacterium]|nr:MarR family transcriptional regulator [Anaerolineae bacterium]